MQVIAGFFGLSCSCCTARAWSSFLPLLQEVSAVCKTRNQLKLSDEGLRHIRQRGGERLAHRGGRRVPQDVPLSKCQSPPRAKGCCFNSVDPLLSYGQHITMPEGGGEQRWLLCTCTVPSVRV